MTPYILYKLTDVSKQCATLHLRVPKINPTKLSITSNKEGNTSAEVYLKLLRNVGKLLPYYTVLHSLHSLHSVTNFMNLRSPSEGTTCATIKQESNILFWNPEVHYSVHKNNRTVPILSQNSPVHTISSYATRRDIM
jgi:hypothetical protein